MREVYHGVEKASFGFKILAAMGWQEGEGLGSAKQGIKSHIKAAKKFDNSGVGAKEATARSQDWTLSMHAYTQVLSGLKELTSAHAVEEEAAAGGGAERKAKRKKRKAVQNDDAKAGDSDEEAPAAKMLKLASHSGRYQKREKNKAVRGYSAVDLAAILGQAEPGPLVEEVKARRRQDDTSSDDDDASGEPAKSQTAAQQPPAGQAPRSLIAKEAVIVKVADAPEDASAWWRGLFQRAGIVGSHRVKPQQAKDEEKQALITIHGFSEQDQTDLYNRAQSIKTTGRVGLGQAGAPKKVGGARWAGTKTVLGSDSDGEEPQGDSDADALPRLDAAAADAPEAADPNCDVLDGGVTIVWHNGIRPAWFLQSRAGQSSSGGDSALRDDDAAPVPAVGGRERRVCDDAPGEKRKKSGKPGRAERAAQAALAAAEDDKRQRRKAAKRAKRAQKAVEPPVKAPKKRAK